ncbi:MAG: thiamine-phosphate kinase [Pseudomonadota bacterium]|nr:thiamine-phosphate kinase [Pseudomonadota bacterium]
MRNDARGGGIDRPAQDPGSLGEFELIDRYFTRAVPSVRHSDVILGIGDDAAVLRVPTGSDLVAAVDTLVAGRHFPPTADARSIGHRALAVNLSDIAAMGATPAWATLALTLPSADAQWLERFSAGFARLADAHGVELVGGDTTAGPLTISVQILGHVARGSALRRGAAQAGDVLAVTGTLGDAGAGLALVTGRLAGTDEAAAAELIERFEYPTPRILFGCHARGVASAAMDLSDGLAGDLPKLAAASGLAAQVDVARLPLSRALLRSAPASQARDWALAAGDDYELLVAVSVARFGELQAIAHRLNLTLTAIGDLRPGSGITWQLDGHAFAAPASGYDHFR